MRKRISPRGSAPQKSMKDLLAQLTALQAQVKAAQNEVFLLKAKQAALIRQLAQITARVEQAALVNPAKLWN